MILLASAAIALVLLSETVSADSSTPVDQILTFLFLGDWGKGGTSGTYGARDRRALGEPFEKESETHRRLPEEGGEGGHKEQKLHQMQVAVAMGNYSRKANPKPSFLVALGDNFYDDGVTSTTDALWKYLWEDVYLGYDELNVPWFPVFG
ncbi:hypothetical protein B484DRAFT_48174 [Ochromonadaceae sp. CCMP2298]|nr:hypothetical protein B484DRAFT_48174 [Ochromonadaceae sp. CCMP2298]|mmetsp:Transcript_30173/g.64990  ORF Transcript_30173/g.64990 Transcript_30173/m.64990 type:complete len:150 (-) Transcript_30173:93-542(-)